MNLNTAHDHHSVSKTSLSLSYADFSQIVFRMDTHGQPSNSQHVRAQRGHSSIDERPSKYIPAVASVRSLKLGLFLAFGTPLSPRQDEVYRRQPRGQPGRDCT